MLDRFYYQNNFGEILYFGQNGLYASYNDLRDYEWGYSVVNGNMKFTMDGTVTREIPVVFSGKSGKAIKMLRNKAHSIVEKDLRANLRGRLYIGEYYLECNIYGMSNDDYLIKDYFLKTTMKLVTDKPYWKKATKFTFQQQSTAESETDSDFPFDFPTDLSVKEQGLVTIKNDNDFDTDFIMTIYGAATAPEILINNHSYKMNSSIASGEKFVIDSDARTIVKHSGGVVYNAFNDRYKVQSIFEKIPKGICAVNWSNDFDFDIILLEKRAEPLWTWTNVSIEDVADAAQVGDTYYLIDKYGKYIRDSENVPISVQTGGDE